MLYYLLSRVSRIMFAIAAYICYPAILLVMSVDVVRRYVFNSPWTWSQEFASLLLFVAIVLSAPEAWLKGVHIRAEFLRANVSTSSRKLIERAVWLLLIVISIALAYQAWGDGQMALLFNDNTPELGVPRMWFSAVLAISAVVTGLIGVFGLVTGLVPDELESANEEYVE